MQNICINPFEAVIQMYSGFVEYTRRRLFRLRDGGVRVEVLRFRARVAAEHDGQRPAVRAYLTVLVHCAVWRGTITL